VLASLQTVKVRYRHLGRRHGVRGGNLPGGPDLLASEADREATQAVLKQAFEDERLTQDEFEARVGKAVAARTQGELAALTRDIPRSAVPAPRRSHRNAWLAAGVGGLAVAGILVGVLSSGSGTSPAQGAAAGSSQAANPDTNTNPRPGWSRPVPGGHLGDRAQDRQCPGRAAGLR
jgi:hypothetical protein